MARYEIEPGFYQSFDTNAIRASFNPARYMGPSSIEKAYEYLFADYPEGLPSFKGVDMNKQYASMLNGLAYVVDHFEDEPKMRKYLFELGRRHVAYGGQERIYEWVTNSIVKSMAYFHQDNWSTELNDEWRKFLIVVKAMIMDGHYSITRAKVVTPENAER